MANQKKLTDRYVASLKCPAGKRMGSFTDSEVKGLTMWVSSTGVKTWRYSYRWRGSNTQAETIGRFPAVDRAQAVAAVERIKRLKDEGHDPKRVAEAVRFTVVPTVGDVLDRHLKSLTRESTRYNTKSVYRDLRKWHGSTTVADFSAVVLKEFIESNYRGRPGAGCLLLRYLVSAFNVAARPSSGLKLPDGFRNPAQGLKADIPFLKGHRPATYATNFEPEDYGKMIAAIETAYGVADVHPMGVAALELCLYTGARPSEITGLKWSEIGEQRGVTVIMKDDHKNAGKGKERVIRLHGRALKVLDRCREYRVKSGYRGEFCFPQWRQQRNSRREHVFQLTHYAQTLTKLSGVKFVPYQLRSAYINHALDSLGSEAEELVARNCGNSVEIIRKHYRKAKEDALDAVAKRVSEEFDRLLA